MARLKNGLVITHITGKLGGGVFSKPSGVQHVYTKRGLTHKTTTNRIGLKRAFATASRLFSELSEAALFHWKTFADSLVFTNRVGNTYTPSVRTVFLKYIVNRVYYNLPIPPIPVRTYISDSINCTFYASSVGLGQILLFLDSTLPSHYIVVEASQLRDASPGGKVRRTSFIFSSNISVDQYFDLSALYISIYGSLSSPASINFKVTLYNSSSLSSKVVFHSNVLVGNSPKYLFDFVPMALGIYSLQLLTESYVGPALEVYNVNTGLSTNIYFVNGYIDTYSIITFSSGSQVRVTKWYDQSNHGNHFISYDGAFAPIIYSGTAFYILKGKASIFFPENESGFNTETLSSFPDNATLYTVAFASSDLSVLAGLYGFEGVASVIATPNIYFDQSGLESLITPPISSLSSVFFQLNTSVRSYAVYVNDVNLTNPSLNIGLNTASQLYIHSSPFFPFSSGGYTSEFLLFNSDVLVYRQLIEFFTNKFYNLY